jgi:hypothetical protein
LKKSIAALKSSQQSPLHRGESDQLVGDSALGTGDGPVEHDIVLTIARLLWRK